MENAHAANPEIGLVADHRSPQEPSVVRSKAANGGQVKTGQRTWPGTGFF